VGADVWILGGHQTDFSRNLTREGHDLADLMREVVTNTFADAQVTAADIDAVHVGNAFGELSLGQGHLGAMPATIDPGLWEAPAARHEAACASGGVSILAALAQLEAGWVETALVVGIEIERSRPGDQASELMRAAGWVGHEAQDAQFIWPRQFSELAQAYADRHGLEHEHLAAVARKNTTNAKDNPNAQTRDWSFPEGAYSEDDELNPVVDGWLRRTDCSQISDGAAGIVLATKAKAETWASERGLDLDDVPRLLGWGHRTVGLPLSQKLQASAQDPYLLPHVRRAAQDAMFRARVASVMQLDGIEVHDCFSTSELLAIEHLGITGPGEAWKAIEDGRTERSGVIPINAGGGLIGGGHPVGATGVRMVLDAHRQTSGTAGAYQVEDARRYATLNIGGSTATTVCFVVGR
jgi:acetyl-CoA C-acetyltransferase